MKKNIFTILFSLVAISTSFAQNVSINTDGSKADSSAMLDVKSGNKGFLPPRVFLINKRDTVTIKKPATGLLVYNTNPNMEYTGCCSTIYMYNGLGWARLMTLATDTLVTATYMPPIPGRYGFREGSNQSFQTFTATQTGVLTSVAILTVGGFGGVGSRPIKFYNGAGNTGTLLATMTLPGSNFSSDYNWETASPPTTQINIIAGQTYTIETLDYLWVLLPIQFAADGEYTGGYSNNVDGSATSYSFKISVAR